jgi:hypothetical protein
MLGLPLYPLQLLSRDADFHGVWVSGFFHGFFSDLTFAALGSIVVIGSHWRGSGA